MNHFIYDDSRPKRSLNDDGSVLRNISGSNSTANAALNANTIHVIFKRKF